MRCRWVLVCCLVLGGSVTARAAELRVAAAISLKQVLGEITAAYRQQSGQAVQVTYGSSGQLAGQIRNGATVDIFIAAADKPVAGLLAERLLVRETQTILARNTLVAIVLTDAKQVPTTPADLAAPRYARIALGEPKLVPAGLYADQALKASGLEPALRPRFIYGGNVRQVLDYVERGEVHVGFVYQTDAKTSAGKVRVAFVVDDKLHDPIVYSAAVVAATRERKEADNFLIYLRGTAAQGMLQRAGFLPPDAPTTQPATRP